MEEGKVLGSFIANDLRVGAHSFAGRPSFPRHSLALDSDANDLFFGAHGDRGADLSAGPLAGISRSETAEALGVLERMEDVNTRPLNHPPAATDLAPERQRGNGGARLRLSSLGEKGPGSASARREYRFVSREGERVGRRWSFERTNGGLRAVLGTKGASPHRFAPRWDVASPVNMELL
uniref:Uncharacterized protein n=1 Tax=Sphaerodactylus townsendi TaxID=933632 RepID=A0ACB8FD54_9SAUR